jgi:hypothetical protein
LPRRGEATLESGKARKRVVIEGVKPEIDGGRFPIKRNVGDRVRVEANIVTDGHDVIMAQLLYRREQDADWLAVSMQPLVNDRWQGEFPVPELGRYRCALQAWVDRFRTWQRDLQKKVDAGQDVAVELLVGAGCIDAVQGRASKAAARKLGDWAKILRGDGPLGEKLAAALQPELTRLMGRYPDERFITLYDRNLAVVVDPVQARYSTWYEMFPRSAAAVAGVHGTFKDCEVRLPYIAGMDFDVLYLPPIHPIGVTNRKGKNNQPRAKSGDVGSPWAIGAAAGGHKSVHPQLGTLEDFRHLVARAYYWHRFYSHQPDLNFDSPDVRKEIIRALNFWLSLGVDGLRLDAVPYLYEREGTNCENLPETHAFLKELRQHVDTRFQNRMLLAEANQWPEDSAAYFGHGDECHMAFHFPLMPRMFMALRMEDRFPIVDILQQTPQIPDNCQ